MGVPAKAVILLPFILEQDHHWRFHLVVALAAIKPKDEMEVAWQKEWTCLLI